MSVRDTYPALAVDRGAELRVAGLWLLVLACAAPVFALGLGELVANWLTPVYSHGPIVVAMALWIGLRTLRDEPRAQRRHPALVIWPGVLLALLGIAGGLVGTLGRIGDVSAYGLIPWIAGVLVVSLGWVRARRLWLSVALLLLALPLPQVLYWKVTTQLQAVASELAASMISAMGMSVYLDGNIIDLGVYRLQVAEACSGLQYLFPILAFAVLFATISREPAWRRVALVLLAAPLAVAMNALRIAITALVVEHYGVSAAEGFLHAFEGWAILLAAIAVLVGVMLLLRACFGRGTQGGPMLDLDISGTGEVLGRVLHVPPARALGVLSVVALAAGVLVLVLGSSQPEAPGRTTFDRFPQRVGAWPGVRGALDPAVAQVVAADDYLNTTYFEPGSMAPVQIFSAFYHNQTRGAAIHSPEICLPANGWEVSEIGTRELDMSAARYGRFEANRAVVTKGTGRQLVYYWFEQRGRRVANDLAVKLGVLADEVLHGRSDGALLRFTTPIDDSAGGLVAAEARVRDLMRQALPQMPGFIPF